MTNQAKDRDIELDENEMIEAHDPETAPADAAKSVEKGGDVTKEAPARPGDKTDQEKADKIKKNPETGKEVKADPNTNVESYDHKGELDKLVESEATLSEEFKAKTAVIFEAALSAKIAEETDRLESEFATRFEEDLKTATDTLVEKLDSYLNYAVENWMKENKLAIENGLRTEIAETFMTDLKKLFTESYIEVPESKVDLVDELASQVEELEEKLNTSVANSLALVEKNENLMKEKIISEASSDLAETEKAKLSKLLENIEYEDDKTFAEKVSIIKESYFSTTKKPINSIEEVNEDDSNEENHYSPAMEAYVSTLKKIKK